MNAAIALPRRWMSLAVLIVSLVLIPACAGDEKPKGDAGGEKPKADPRRAAELVDAIANRNKPPKFVDWPKSEYPGTRTAALFPEDYDWKEEERVRKAIKQLENDQTEVVWEELVKRTGDQRYCVIEATEMKGDAHVIPLGAICGRIAYWRLIGVFRQHLPLVKSDWGRINLRLDVGIGDLSGWRKQRAARSLYELQIEVCERAIEDLGKEEGIPQAQKDESRRKLEAQIAELKKSKRPVHVPDNRPFPFSYHLWYDADIAKRVREGVKTGNYEDIGILLGLYK